VKKINKVEALNLYAKIEDLLGIKEYSPKLYNYYIEILNKIEFNSLLDIGCGSGDFLKLIELKYHDVELKGIDRSTQMVKISKDRGLNVTSQKLYELDKKYDVVVATFDMVNYLNPQEFIDFFEDLKSVVKSNGYFIFDLNTEFGLSDLAVGNFIAEDNKRFLAIESFYEAGVYESYFTLFEQFDNCYKKSKDKIFQYYYSRDFISLLGGWEIDSILPIKLYGMEKFDKEIYFLRNKI